MVDIADIVAASTTLTTRTPAVQTFSQPLLLGYHDRYADVVREYGNLEEIAADGIATWHPLYLMAAGAFAHNPRPRTVKLGKIAAPAVVTKTLTITTAVEGATVRVRAMAATTGATVTVTYTVPAAATVASVATAVELLLEAVPGLSSTATGAAITVTLEAAQAAAGHQIYLWDLQGCTITDATADAGYDTALSAISAIDDDWYGVALDTPSEANIADAVTWATSRTKTVWWEIADTSERSDAAFFVAQAALESTKSWGIFSERTQDYVSARTISAMLTRSAGRYTLFGKQLPGALPYNSLRDSSNRMSTAEESAILSAGGWLYTQVGGTGMLYYRAEDAAYHPDIRHGQDEMNARIRERVLSWLLSQDKAPYNAITGDQIAGEIAAVLTTYESSTDRPGFIEPGWRVDVPDLTAVTPAERLTRIMRETRWYADTSGAVHHIRITGSLS